jgi:hypothetical protein
MATFRRSLWQGSQSPAPGESNPRRRQDLPAGGTAINFEVRFFYVDAGRYGTYAI